MAMAAAEDGGPRGVVDLVGVFLRQSDHRAGMPDAGEFAADKPGETFRRRLRR